MGWWGCNSKPHWTGKSAKETRLFFFFWSFFHPKYFSTHKFYLKAIRHPNNFFHKLSLSIALLGKGLLPTCNYLPVVMRSKHQKHVKEPQNVGWNLISWRKSPILKQATKVFFWSMNQILIFCRRLNIFIFILYYIFSSFCIAEKNFTKKNLQGVMRNRTLTLGYIWSCLYLFIIYNLYISPI